MGGGGRQRVTLEGRDMRAQVVVTLEDAATGVEKDVPVTRTDDRARRAPAAVRPPGGTARRARSAAGTGQRRTQRAHDPRRDGVALRRATRAVRPASIIDPPCPACAWRGPDA